jgi:hypothetical protein
MDGMNIGDGGLTSSERVSGAFEGMAAMMMNLKDTPLLTSF